MKEEFISVANIPTHILTWGPTIDEKFPNKEIVICIPGNPGLPGFYTKFLTTIHNTVGTDMPVWIIGHAGHSEPDNLSAAATATAGDDETDNLIIPELNGNEMAYGLQGQVKHKIEFIKRYVPKDVKIHLIGHSIGAWMIIELLKNSEIQQKIQQSYLLFPTIERMARSTNGWIFTKIISPLWFFLRCFILIFAELPRSWKKWILIQCLYILSISKYFLKTILKYSQPAILDKVVFLAREEMEQVVMADLKTIQENVTILKFYYGSADGWVPKKYFYQLKEKIPELNGEIDQWSYEHAFVLRDSIGMGKLVSEWILIHRVV